MYRTCRQRETVKYVYDEMTGNARTYILYLNRQTDGHIYIIHGLAFCH